MDKNNLSKRGQHWVEFSERVLKHIEDYTVPQYGDEGNDLLTDWSAETCFKAIEKYVKRKSSNMREGQEELDAMKIAHFNQVYTDKMLGLIK